MWAQAKHAGIPGRAAGVRGYAERLPIRSNTVDVAWLSTMLHHVDDLASCAAELARVLTPDGRVLIRGLFGDQGGGQGWLRFFPDAKRAVTTFPSTRTVIDTFGKSGLLPLALVDVDEPAMATTAEASVGTAHAPRRHAPGRLHRRRDRGRLSRHGGDRTSQAARANSFHASGSVPSIVREVRVVRSGRHDRRAAPTGVRLERRDFHLHVLSEHRPARAVPINDPDAPVTFDAARTPDLPATSIAPPKADLFIDSKSEAENVPHRTDGTTGTAVGHDIHGSEPSRTLSSGHGSTVSRGQSAIHRAALVS